MLNTTRDHIRKYSSGDPEKLCIHGSKNKGHSMLDEYKDTILELLSQKMKYKDIFEILFTKGYKGKLSILFGYCKKCKDKYGVEVNAPKINRKYINRQDILKHIWSKKDMDERNKRIVFDKYPSLLVIESCVKEFRDIYEQKKVSLLHSFLGKYSNCQVSNLKTFVNGIKKDIRAVEASVEYEYSNSILEGNINRLKAIKRTMYGRAKLPLLRAKVLSSLSSISSLFTHTQICG